MIKQIRPAFYHNKRDSQYCCLSTDIIPDYLENGDEVYFIDTGKKYVYDSVSGQLYEKPSGGGGGTSVYPYDNNPEALGQEANPGTSDNYSRGDHVHPKPSAIDIGAAAADLGISSASVGQYIKIKTVDGSGKPTEFEPGTPSGGGGGVYAGTITLSATWTGSASPYTQTVTVTGATVTANSKVDLQPDATALAQLISDGVAALFVTNNAGTLTATAIGAATTAALTMQCTVTEVS